jgi:glyoxylase-like metal-dependent hydrolase (beta-lactamase superfamily II)
MSARDQVAIRAFFDEPSNTVSYLVHDRESRAGAIVDPVLDYDHRSGHASTDSAQDMLKAAETDGVKIEWVLETHAHADHLSAAPFIKAKTGARVGIGEHIKQVQRIFTPLFNLDDISQEGREFDHLFGDGERFALGLLKVEVMHVPGHTPADIAYRIEDAVFVGDTLFMPDYGTARADFPGGDARKLYRSIQRLLKLPEATRLFMCHDYKAPARSLCVGDDRRSGEGERPSQGSRRGGIRALARGARPRTCGAAIAAAGDPGQHQSREIARAGVQRGPLFQDPGEAQLSFSSSP